MEYFGEGAADAVVDERQAAALLERMLEQLGPLQRVLLLPPDHTRLHSFAGELTGMLYRRLEGTAEVTLLPTLGTHAPMGEAELNAMFPGIPHERFLVHDWRNDLVSLGVVPGDVVREVSEGRLSFSIDCSINRTIVEGGWDRIISIGQLVPHEVIGIANHNKNLFVGAGGTDIINKTHFLGAVFGMERIMGRAKSPVRDVLNWADEHLAPDLPVSYVLTVRARDEEGVLVTRGLFGGDDRACFERGAQLCQEVNLELLDEPIEKAVVYLPPAEYSSTWLGNKAVYRTRMAMADGGRLIVLAPGVRVFGEDRRVDELVRKHGYRGTPHTQAAVDSDPELAANLSAAAHLIHGSSEGRFEITYCTDRLTRQEVTGVGFEHAPLGEMLARYDPVRLAEGWNELSDGERIFFISNPALGLWGTRRRFGSDDPPRP